MSKLQGWSRVRADPTTKWEEYGRARQLVFERDRWICQECGCDVTEYAHIDHIKELRFGGELIDLSNMRTVCGDCHKWKTALMDLEDPTIDNRWITPPRMNHWPLEFVPGARQPIPRDTTPTDPNRYRARWFRVKHDSQIWQVRPVPELKASSPTPRCNHPQANHFGEHRICPGCGVDLGPHTWQPKPKPAPKKRQYRLRNRDWRDHTNRKVQIVPPDEFERLRTVTSEPLWSQEEMVSLAQAAEMNGRIDPGLLAILGSEES